MVSCASRDPARTLPKPQLANWKSGHRSGPLSGAAYSRRVYSDVLVVLVYYKTYIKDVFLFGCKLFQTATWLQNISWSYVLFWVSTNPASIDSYREICGNKFEATNLLRPEFAQFINEFMKEVSKHLQQNVVLKFRATMLDVKHCSSCWHNSSQSALERAYPPD